MRALLPLLGLVLLTGCASAQDITPVQVKTLLDSPAKPLLLDVRTLQEFQDSRIPGSRLFTLDTINAQTAAQIIPSKDTPVVLYCRSGARSARAQSLLKDLGYTQVKNLGGIISWPYTKISGPEPK